jgi:hypothetical protein
VIWLTGVGYTRESRPAGVGYTGESGLASVAYTGESRLPGVAYTGESKLTCVTHTWEVPLWLSITANSAKFEILIEYHKSPNVGYFSRKT